MRVGDCCLRSDVTPNSRLQVRAAVSVPLKLRIPGWATKATVAVNGGAAGPTTPLSYHTVVCDGGDDVTEVRDCDFGPTASPVPISEPF